MKKPKENNSVLAQNILARLKAIGKAPTAASIEAFGNDGTIRNILNGQSRNPRADTLEKLAAVLETTSEWLLRRHDGDSLLEGTRKPLPKREDAEDQVKVYSSAEGGDGSMVLMGDPFYEPRPNILPEEDDLYGVVVEGTSMVKMYRPGDTAWVHPNHRERRDEPCVFRRFDDVTGETSMTIKWLSDFNATVWKVEQFNPPREFELKKADWPECYRVLGKKNRP